MKTLAIIPARGGSKRIPRKNVLEVGGKALIVHTVNQAQNSNHIDRVVVSTDDDEIADVSQRAGAEVLMRPAALSNGTATSESALIHALDELADTYNYVPDELVFLQCTSPLRRPTDIDDAIDRFRTMQFDSLFSVSRFRKYVWKLDGQIPRSVNFDYQAERWREQDFPEQYEENGSIYVMRPWVLRSYNYRFGGRMGLYEMDSWGALQVDTPEDFALCAAAFKSRVVQGSNG